MILASIQFDQTKENNFNTVATLLPNVNQNSDKIRSDFPSTSCQIPITSG